MASLLAGCNGETIAAGLQAANYQKMAANTTFGDAKDFLQRQLRKYPRYNRGVPVPDAWQFTAAGIEEFNLTSDGRRNHSMLCAYEALAPWQDVNETPGSVLVYTSPANDGAFITQFCENRKALTAKSENEGNQIAAAMQRLKMSTPAERQEYFSSIQTRIDAAAAEYRRQGPEAQTSEQFRRVEVIATQAVKNKQFAAAVDTYEDQLKATPWWALGQFNVALILAEMLFFNEAIEHMQTYVALVPGAPNARAAQDKIYIWEGELKSFH